MPSSQIQSPKKRVLLPVFKLSGTPVVLLPGILYRINFQQQDALSLLHYYKNNKLVNNLLVSNLKTTFETKHVISEEALQGGRVFRKFFNGDFGDETAYDWLLLGVIPEEGKNIATVSRIVGIANDSKNIMITFQALTRGELVDKATAFEYGTVKELELDVISNSVDLGQKFLSSNVGEFNSGIDKLFKNIDGFLHDFLIATSIDKTSTEGKKYALTLSPLANALNVQFSGDYKLSSIKLKGLVEKFNANYDSYSSKKNSENFLKILDLTIAVLPVQKYEFLSKIDIISRLELFNVVISDLNLLFDSLYRSINYVETFYSKATDLEKSKIISSQLKSIKFALDSIKPKAPGSVGSNQRFSGNGANGGSDDSDELELIANFVANIPSDVDLDGVKLIKKDYKRLRRMPTQHSEYQVLRTYFDVILDIPFGQYVNFSDIDVQKASLQLNNDHYGLYHVKKRLLEYLSVLKLHKMIDSQQPTASNPDEELVLGLPNSTAKSEKDVMVKPRRTKAPIILLVGPPGVGKTSLAKSIAAALGRKFQRVSLGGIRDESEIRGHRRTYVGSMPGVIISALRKAGTMNPLILLDEIDKVCGGANSAGRVNGDPEAALLEVLDPEQNSTFTDHYIGFPVDLSNVLFLCTANELSTISAPLRDRTEIIELAGYTADEKINIASKFLLPKQVKANGLPADSVSINQDIWFKIVTEYIRESGVRNLERKVAAICRGKAVEYVENKDSYKKDVEMKKLVKYLGLPDHPISKDLLDKPKYSNSYGVVNGLSYNSNGSGGVLVFEVISIPTSQTKSDSPKLVLTGRLGETLTESIKIGISFIKSIISRHLISGVNAEILEKFNNSELHLHVPMGGISKDGPSAGITITLALLSIALSKEVNSSFAMTGEITLRGKVLPIGGVSEKLLGASQYGIKTVLLPKLNRKDVIEGFFNDDEDKLAEFIHDESSDEPERKVKEKLGLTIIYVDTFWDVIKAVWGNEISIESNDQLSNHL